MRCFCIESNYHAFAAVIAAHQQQVEFGGGAVDLAPLCQIKGVKLARAKTLYRAGLCTAEDIAKANVEVLSDILGRGVARMLKRAAADACREGAAMICYAMIWCAMP